MSQTKLEHSFNIGEAGESAIHERIARKIVSLIRERHLGAGDKLPPERELAELMGVSRPTLRESLKALSLLNILEMRQGDGTYVSSLDVSLLIEPFGFFFTIDYPSLAQLFEVRKAVEVLAAELAAKRAKEGDIETLEACIRRAVENRNDQDIFLQADIELHEKIAEATGNPILARFIISLRVIGKVSRARTVKIPGVVELTVRDHKRIVEAIKARNISKAKRAMLEHLDHVENALQGDFFSGEDIPQE